MNKICVNYQAHRWADYIRITRCYKCQRYGHIANNCKESTEICGKCARAHPTNSCNETQKCCINCKRISDRMPNDKNKIKTNHATIDSKCTVFLRAKSNAISRIDYGD